MVEVINLSYSHGYREIIHPFNITLEDGSLTGFVGRSGCGKTLLLKILSGETGKYRGQIMINGRELSTYSTKERVREVWSFRGSFPGNQEEPVRSFLLAARLPYKKPLRSYSDDDLQATEKYLHQFELLSIADVPLGKLPGSSLRKALLAHAFVREPHIMVLDNPSEGLDLKDRELFMNALAGFVFNGNRLAVMASNDLNLVFQKADRVVFMNEGKVYPPVNVEQIDAEIIRHYFGTEVMLSRNIYNGRPEVHIFTA